MSKKRKEKEKKKERKTPKKFLVCNPPAKKCDFDSIQESERLRRKTKKNKTKK